MIETKSFYLMYRGWMDNPVFKDAPYSEREAWVWLVENAAFKETRTEIKGNDVTLSRGQLSYGLRYLEKAWKWDLSKVRRFLKRLEKRHMIDTENDTGQNIITICNYNEYQDRSKKVTQEETEKRHRSDTEVTQIRKKETIKQAKKDSPLTPQRGNEEESKNELILKTEGEENEKNKLQIRTRRAKKASYTDTLFASAGAAKESF